MGSTSSRSCSFEDLFSRPTLIDIIRESKEAEIEAYRGLKALYDDVQWESTRKEIFRWKKTSRHNMAQYYAEDGLTDRLAKIVLGAKSYNFFNRYASDLAREKKYIQQILAKYESYFNDRASEANKRNKYEALVHLLEDAHKITGGKEMNDRLTTQWLTDYKRRRAFCEEINKYREEYLKGLRNLQKP